MTTTFLDREKAYKEWEGLLKRATTPEESDKIATANQLNSPLLRLPGEIRNHIYTYACRSTTVKHGKRPEVSERSCLFTQTFLLTCKQFYCEAIALLYTHATFELSGFGGWAANVSLNPKYRNLISSLYMDGGYLTTAIRKAWEFKAGIRAKPDLPGVERVLLKQPVRANDVCIDALRGLFGKPNLQVTDEEITDPYWLLKMQDSSRQPGTYRC
ncbi:uncharacterized protein J4E84_007335 [Alternaria hordeiaustralica]|uniref:uncharacterized protein n=1 Tax=Alternaria hordeiaustralica TaxID=1187925 RepID=UPI0020C2D2D3|nr:uncharacterized protein J4E84_007335 [Alternaria hordeiaustralica]KAI4681740.1 hypothetical protein J4E84_007335 [Alternaria hordeiaustralica]